MKFCSPRFLCLLVLATGTSFVAAQTSNPDAHPVKRALASPFSKVGPQAVPAAAGSNYGLFTCQVGRSSATCYDPYQMRHAYGTDQLISAGYTGKGKTIVIIDAFGDPYYLPSDLAAFDTFYGLPKMNGADTTDASAPTLTVIAPDGYQLQKDGSPVFDEGWAQETTLDVEWAHAIAPGANIVLVVAKTNYDTDMLSATKYAVDHNLGDVISQSFGENESCMDPTLLGQEHQVFADATAKNMTIFASAGDYGATQGSCDGKSFVKAASSPATDPLVTAVGGTELHAASYCLAQLGCDPTKNPAAGAYQGEIVWNESAIGGEATGGGFSVVYDEPFNQQGTLNGGKQRGAPDVSYNAAVYHGVLVNFEGGWWLFGGTSAGSPQWAAITAIADEKAGHNLGFINAALYQLSQARPAYATSFFDVTSGNNSFAGVTGFNAGPGWDAATGLGSPSAAQIATQLAQFVSAGDGAAAINSSKPHANNKPTTTGHVTAH